MGVESKYRANLNSVRERVDQSPFQSSNKDKTPHLSLCRECKYLLSETTTKIGSEFRLGVKIPTRQDKKLKIAHPQPAFNL